MVGAVATFKDAGAHLMDVIVPEFDEAALDEVYWGHFWPSQCSYPNRTGALASKGKPK